MRDITRSTSPRARSTWWERCSDRGHLSNVPKREFRFPVETSQIWFHRRTRILLGFVKKFISPITALPKQTRDAMNQLRFVQINRRRVRTLISPNFYMKITILQYLKIYLDIFIQTDPKIFRYLGKTVLFMYILWVLSSLTTLRYTREKENIIWKM